MPIFLKQSFFDNFVIGGSNAPNELKKYISNKTRVILVENFCKYSEVASKGDILVSFIEKGAGKGRAITLTEPLEPENRVPIVGNVAAGSPILAEECIEDYLAFDTGGRSDEYFALHVRGDSMINAGILSGDLVVVRRQQVANNGEIVVALLEDEATVKRFSRRNGHVWLLPENEAYSPIDGTYARILGRVAAVVRRYD